MVTGRVEHVRKERSTERAHNAVAAKRNTLTLQWVRQLEAALEAWGRGVRSPGSKDPELHHSWLYKFLMATGNLHVRLDGVL